MNSRELAQSLFAVIGVWLVAEAVTSVPFAIQMIATAWDSNETSDTHALGAWVSSLTLRTVVGLLLVSFRDALASRFTSSTSAVEQIPSETLLATAFALVGVYYVLAGLPGVLAAAVSGGFWGMSAWQLAGESVFETLLGGGLFLGSRGLSHYWHRLRSAGAGRAA